MNKYNKNIQISQLKEIEVKKLERKIEVYLSYILGIEKKVLIKNDNLFRVINYSSLNRWDGKSTYDLKSNFKIEKVGNLIKNISTGTTPPTSRVEYFNDGNINFYTPADLTDKMYLNSSERKVTQLAINDRKARRFEKGSLLFVGIGSTIGKVGIVGNDFATSNQQITGLLFDESKVSIDYVYYYFNYFSNITTKEKTQATIPIVNQDKILNIVIPVPALNIQIQISKHISEIKQQINNLQTQSILAKKLAIKEFEKEIFN